jgi:hypothetical protein
VIFSGDLGPRGAPLHRDYVPFEKADVVFAKGTNLTAAPGPVGRGRPSGLGRFARRIRQTSHGLQSSPSQKSTGPDSAHDGPGASGAARRPWSRPSAARRGWSEPVRSFGQPG